MWCNRTTWLNSFPFPLKCVHYTAVFPYWICTVKNCIGVARVSDCGRLCKAGYDRAFSMSSQGTRWVYIFEVLIMYSKSSNLDRLWLEANVVVIRKKQAKLIPASIIEIKKWNFSCHLSVPLPVCLFALHWTQIRWVTNMNAASEYRLLQFAYV